MQKKTKLNLILTLILGAIATSFTYNSNTLAMKENNLYGTNEIDSDKKNNKTQTYYREVYLNEHEINTDTINDVNSDVIDEINTNNAQNAQTQTDPEQNLSELTCFQKIYEDFDWKHKNMFGDINPYKRSDFKIFEKKMEERLKEEIKKNNKQHYCQIYVQYEFKDKVPFDYLPQHIRPYINQKKYENEPNYFPVKILNNSMSKDFDNKSPYDLLAYFELIRNLYKNKEERTLDLIKDEQPKHNFNSIFNNKKYNYYHLYNFLTKIRCNLFRNHESLLLFLAHGNRIRIFVGSNYYYRYEDDIIKETSFKDDITKETKKSSVPPKIIKIPASCEEVPMKKYISCIECFDWLNLCFFEERDDDREHEGLACKVKTFDVDGFFNADDEKFYIPKQFGHVPDWFKNKQKGVSNDDEDLRDLYYTYLSKNSNEIVFDTTRYYSDWDDLHPLEKFELEENLKNQSKQLK